MENAPRNMWDVSYTWGVFTLLGTGAFTLAEVVSRKHVHLVSESMDTGAPVAKVRIYLMLVAAYALVVFYVTMLLLCAVLFCMCWMTHTIFEAIMRLDDYWQTKGWARKLLNMVDHVTDPALQFAFLSKRLWSIHGAILGAAICVVVVQVRVFSSASRLRRQLGIRPTEPPPKGALTSLASDTLSILVVLMVALYMMVYLRDVLLMNNVQQES